jgi:hypothetical protein
MQGDPRSQLRFCSTLQARELARPPSRENRKSFADQAAAAFDLPLRQRNMVITPMITCGK